MTVSSQTQRNGRRQELQRTGGRREAQGTGKQRDDKKRGILWVIVCLLLMINIILLLGMQSQIKSMNQTLNQVLGKLLQVSGESNVTRESNVLGESNIFGGSNVPGKRNISEEDGVLGQDDYLVVVNDSVAESGEVSPEYYAAYEKIIRAAVINEYEDYAEQCRLPEVAKPVKRTEAEVLEYLEMLAMDNDVIAKIWENSAAYPAKMLEALANNPEMADFVEGYLQSGERPEKKLTESEKQQKYPLFLQWDPRWGYEEYGDESNIGLAGCGPVCLSMVLYYLLGDEELTPDKIAKYSMENGYYVYGTGTAWALLEDVAALYGVKVNQIKTSEKGMKKALDDGKIMICSMGPGDFTAYGHFVVIYGYDSDGFLVNDPNCAARSKEKWTYGQIGRQIKNIWTFGGT